MPPILHVSLFPIMLDHNTYWQLQRSKKKYGLRLSIEQCAGLPGTLATLQLRIRSAHTYHLVYLRHRYTSEHAGSPEKQEEEKQT